jgi:phage tail sheath protein FI
MLSTPWEIPRRPNAGGDAMPVRPTYPGVYIEEIPSGVTTITGVATSVAAFVGSFARGLADEAVQLFSMADFEREYGGLDRFSETSYGVQQFFKNGGSEAWVVRVVDTVGVPEETPPVPATPASPRAAASGGQAR